MENGRLHKKKMEKGNNRRYREISRKLDRNSKEALLLSLFISVYVTCLNHMRTLLHESYSPPPPRILQSIYLFYPPSSSFDVAKYALLIYNMRGSLNNPKEFCNDVSFIGLLFSLLLIRRSF